VSLLSSPLTPISRPIVSQGTPRTIVRTVCQPARQPAKPSQSVRGENFIKRFECVGRGFT
jgi:hypothetical protein